MEAQVNSAHLINFHRVLQLDSMIRQRTQQGVHQMVAVTLQTVTHSRQAVSTSHSANITLPFCLLVKRRKLDGV